MKTHTSNVHPELTKEEFDLHTRTKHRTMKVLFWIAVAVAFVAIVSAIGVVQLRNQLKVETADLPTLRDANIGVQFYDRNNKYICTMRADRDREPIALENVSQNMRNALLSAEDHHFYEHHGIDFIGVARAFKKNLEAGHIVEGASTITQQLVRNLFLDKNDRSYKRKLKEVFLSWDTENRYSKSKILETYLNEVYFGGGVYGIERAANHYFNKHAAQLSIPESAFLAGVIKSPSVYGNPGNVTLAVLRQREVLNKMAEYGYIDQKKLAQLKATKLNFVEGADPVKYPYYLSYALEQVKKEMGAKMWTQSLKVYTNLDPAAQRVAAAKLNRGIKNAPYGVNQGALVTMKVSDGAVVAMVGGVGDYEDNQWNRALHPHTAGSCFKPFVYLAALMSGTIEPDSMINDEQMSLKEENAPDWVPKNFDGQFKGWVTVRDALINSRNICAIRVAMATGIQSVIDAARSAGMTAGMDPYPSLALGTCAVSPLELATSYATLARNGVYMPPQMLREIISADGKDKRIFKATPSSNLPGASVAMLVDAMQDVVNCGTGTQARLAGIPVAGKTGTADGARDIWFCGFTPDTVTAVWGGNDKNLKVRGQHVTGGTVMARIWHDYMAAYYSLHRPTKTLAFAKPETKFVGPLPEISDETLLTTDATAVDVSDLDKVPAVDPLTVNSNQMANNVPTLISNAMSAREKGIGKAFIVLASEAAERFQDGGGAAARNYTANAAASVSARSVREYGHNGVTVAQAPPATPANRQSANQYGLPTIDAAQQAYAKQAYALQAQYKKQESPGSIFEQPATAANTY